jgi:hypothetical protein
MSQPQLDFTAIQVQVEQDPELSTYGPLALLLFTLQLYLNVEDLSEFAANSLTDGGNDKKLDLCHIDEEEGTIVIAQSYVSQIWGKPAAPANKASDLNTAIAWLCSASEDRIPPGIRPKAQEMRRLMVDGLLRHIKIFFVHNCLESLNVDNELKAVADATRDIVKSAWTNSSGQQTTVSYEEIGLRTIIELYASRDSDILIDDWVDLPNVAFLEQSGEEWKAVVTSVPGSWIRNLYVKHGDRLFSANFRDYLGAAARKDNINYQIKQTAASEPGNFWAYNNGVTALTHQIDKTSGLRIRGISIINGAQTSGALGESAEIPDSDIRVLLRLVEAKSKPLIDKIIQFNNTQNEIKPADRRSSHPVQSRLRSEFQKYGLTYSHRRSSSRIPRGAITVTSIANALCAFHGDPQTAYRNAKEIFNSDERFDLIFRKNISAEHVYLVHTLATALDSAKNSLRTNENATRLQEQQFELLKYSPSKHFMLFVMGQISEQLMNRRISDLYEWKVKPANISPAARRVILGWEEALDVVLPRLTSVVERYGPVYDVQRSIEKSRDVVKEMSVLLSSLEKEYAPKLKTLREVTTV